MNDRALRAAVITLFFFFNDTATTEIYTLSLHDALPISDEGTPRVRRRPERPAGALRGVQHPLHREPRPISRDPGDPHQGLDAGAFLPRGEALPLPRRVRDAEAQIGRAHV